MSFESDVKKIATKTGKRLDQVSRAVKIELFNSVIMDTRVKTGRFRGNWQTQEGFPILMAIDREDKIKQGVAGGAAMSDVSKRVGSGVTYLTNNLPYAQRWEDEDAMVGKNLARIQRIVKEKAREI